MGSANVGCATSARADAPPTRCEAWPPNSEPRKQIGDLSKYEEIGSNHVAEGNPFRCNSRRASQAQWVIRCEAATAGMIGSGVLFGEEILVGIESRQRFSRRDARPMYLTPQMLLRCVDEIENPDEGCDECNPKPIQYELPARIILAVLALFGAISLFGLLLLDQPAYVRWGAPVLLGATCAWVVFHGTKRIKLSKVKVPPRVDDTIAGTVGDWTILYLGASERAIFGWFTVLGVAHTGILGWLGPKLYPYLNKASSSQAGAFFLLSFGFLGLGVVCLAGARSVTVTSTRAHRAIHIMRHQGKEGVFFGHVHEGDRRRRTMVVGALFGILAGIWTAAGALAFVIGLLLNSHA